MVRSDPCPLPFTRANLAWNVTSRALPYLSSTVFRSSLSSWNLAVNSGSWPPGQNYRDATTNCSAPQAAATMLVNRSSRDRADTLKQPAAPTMREDERSHRTPKNCRITRQRRRLMMLLAQSEADEVVLRRAAEADPHSSAGGHPPPSWRS